VTAWELKREPTEQKRRRIARRNQQLNNERGTDDEYDWIEWNRKDHFARECRAGDTLIQIYRALGRKRPVVTRRVRVVLRDVEPDLIRIYTQSPSGQSNDVSWTRFRKILKHVEFPHKLSRRTARKLDPDMADQIDRVWTRVR
jgi:hypothetical protein